MEKYRNTSQTFEEYLRDKHAESYNGTDDDMSDSFDKWLTEIQVDNMIDFAEEWHSRSKQIDSNGLCIGCGRIYIHKDGCKYLLK